MLPGDPGALATMIPVGRLGKPEEVADLALAVLRNGYRGEEAPGGARPGRVGGKRGHSWGQEPP